MTDAQEELEARLRKVFGRAKLDQRLGKIGDTIHNTPKSALFVGILCGNSVFVGSCRTFKKEELLRLAQATRHETLVVFKARFLDALSATPESDHWIINGRMGGVMPRSAVAKHVHRIMKSGVLISSLSDLIQL